MSDSEEFSQEDTSAHSDTTSTDEQYSETSDEALQGDTTSTTSDDALEEDFLTRFQLLKLGLMQSHELRTNLRYMLKPALKNGKTFIYVIWKSLLHRFLLKPDREVYLATPFLDSRRMTDICDMVLQHSVSANIKRFYVRNTCYGSKKIREVMDVAETNFPQMYHGILEREVYDKIVSPSKLFHAKFIACVNRKLDIAAVLLTSANFTNHHFEIDNWDSVVYHTMPVTEFESRFSLD